MMWFTKKKISVPTEDRVELDGTELWSVSWWSRHGEFYNDLEKELK